MGLFKPGEEAIVIGGKKRPTTDCIVRSEMRPGVYKIEVPGFPNLSGRCIWSAKEHELRKKKPPKKELGSWKEVQKITEGWNPTKETENV